MARNKAGELEPIGWNEALELFCWKFKEIQAKHGKDAIAFLSTGQITTEEHAFLGALAKFGMGMVHGDGNTRQCMATAVAAYKQSFGWDAPPFTYKDLEIADVLVFVGSNPVIAHPIIWNRVKMNPNNPKILVVDPLLSETAKQATHHYPIRPGTQLLFLYTVAHILIRKGWIDEKYIKEHTDGFEEFKKHVEKYPPATTCDKIGLPESKIEEFARIIHEGKAVALQWMVGINQAHQATRSAQAIINIALITGNMGRPGTGANSITGQCNAMGSRMFSNTASMLGGHDFANPDHRQKIARILGINVTTIPQVGSMTYELILDAIDKGKIKGLWVVCTNPVHSWINSNTVPAILKKLDFLVVQDMFHSTETARLAHLILPAAGTGEKLGTFINSERRFGVIQPVSKPPGQALPDFDIFKKVAQAWGCGKMFARWTDPEATLLLLKEITRGLPWDITGIESYDQILAAGGIQWPYPDSGTRTKEIHRRLLDDGAFFHTNGKAKFMFEDVVPEPEPVDAAYPFVLVTGRGTVVQWHTQTRTGKAKLLVKAAPKDPYVEINSQDADRLGILPDSWVVVGSRRGEVKVKAAISDRSLPGEVFMPMHYAETNQVTYPSFDAYSHEPVYKLSAVNIRPASQPSVRDPGAEPAG
ncbi:MAG: molybdopterin-dependent oxidoreductase [Candidatus Lokiarchaeota archaeon]|nr:molybdopterin-dependent oxidoreductase [Candidatus Lokiarchaeota archaeon]